MNNLSEDGSPPVKAPLSLPLEFEAHYITNQEAYHAYALVRLGTSEAAEEAVHRAFLEILRHWNDLLTESNLQQQTWTILRRVVISQALLHAQASLTDSDNPVHQALAKLPARQFDALVLRHWLRQSNDDIAWYMGITSSTVDYHCRRGRERLAHMLHRPVRLRKSDARKSRKQRSGT